MTTALMKRGNEIIIESPRKYSMPVEIKIAREERKREQIRANSEMISALLKNPALTILLSYIVLELLQKYKITSGGLTGGFEEGAVMTGIVTTVGLQQIAPMLPDIIRSSGEGLTALLKAIPALTQMVGMAAAAGA
jgi:hypothetical protein